MHGYRGVMWDYRGQKWTFRGVFGDYHFLFLTIFLSLQDETIFDYSFWDDFDWGM
jgi:hypothetical protein